MRKLLTFCREVYHPGVHLYFALNWYLSLYMGLRILQGREITFSWNLIVGVLTLFLVLLYLRIVDEIKDYDYDKVFNQDRPLVKGTITVKDLYLYLGTVIVFVFALNAKSSPTVLLLLTFEFIYSYLLIPLERSSKFIRDNILVNLIVTYPVNVLLSVYVLIFEFGAGRDPEILLIVAFAFAFLYYEFARKISWPHQEKPGQRSYSSFFKTRPATNLSLALAFLSTYLLFYLFKTWLPLILILPLFWGVSLLIKSKKTNKFAPMKLSGSAFIGLFYGVIIAWGILKLLNLSHYFTVGS